MASLASHRLSYGGARAVVERTWLGEAWFINDKSMVTVLQQLYILSHWSVQRLGSFNIATIIKLDEEAEFSLNTCTRV